MPDGLTRQLGEIFATVDAMRIVRLQADGFEADDIIATLARRFRDRVAVNIVSGDKDLLQLVDERVHVIRPGKGAVLENEMDGAALQEKTGLRADQMVDFLALLGDTTDNIPGVRGIGDKTATELLQRFGTLDEIYSRVNEIEKASVRTRLQAGRDAAYQSRDLVRLHDDVPLDVELEEMVRRDHRTESFAEILQRLEFKRMHEQLFGAEAPPPVREPEKPRPPAEPEIPVRYHGVTTPVALEQLVQQISSADEIAVDVETSSLDPMRATLAGIAVALVPGEAFYIPVASEIEDDIEGAIPGLL